MYCLFFNMRSIKTFQFLCNIKIHTANHLTFYLPSIPCGFIRHDSTQRYMNAQHLIHEEGGVLKQERREKSAQQCHRIVLIFAIIILNIVPMKKIKITSTIFFRNANQILTMLYSASTTIHHTYTYLNKSLHRIYYYFYLYFFIVIM